MQFRQFRRIFLYSDSTFKTTGKNSCQRPRVKVCGDFALVRMYNKHKQQPEQGTSVRQQATTKQLRTSNNLQQARHKKHLAIGKTQQATSNNSEKATNNKQQVYKTQEATSKTQNVRSNKQQGRHQQQQNLAAITFRTTATATATTTKNEKQQTTINNNFCCVYLCLSVSICIYPCLSVSIYAHLCPSMSIHAHVHPYPSISIHFYSCPSMSNISITIYLYPSIQSLCACTSCIISLRIISYSSLPSASKTPRLRCFLRLLHAPLRIFRTIPGRSSGDLVPVVVQSWTNDC